MKNRTINGVIKSFLAILIIACNSSTKNQFKGEKVMFTISPSDTCETIKEAQFSIDSICILQMPNDIIEIMVDKIFVTNERIYFLDTEVTRMLYIFDNNGNFIHKIGERGKARNEFIGKPDDFFVDSKNRLHVFDKLGHKIIVYNKDCSVINVINTDEYFPHSFGLTSNNKYMMYFTQGHKKTGEDSPSSLLLFEPDFKNYTKLMSSERNSFHQITSHSFSQNEERLSHIPCFSDSVIVFKNDTVEKVVLFDFSEKFLSKKMPEMLELEEDFSFMNNYKGVLGLIRYEESNSLIYLNYIYKTQGIHWLYNKKNGQMVNGFNLFEGINPYSYYFLKGNQIIAYVDKETVERYKQLYDKKEFKENLEKSPIQMKDLLEGKINAPALFFISLK